MARPPLLRHLWSLAVEEQFYLLWPLAVAAGLGAAAAADAEPACGWGRCASVALMALLYEPLSDPSRVYFGTDTRAVGLLIGAGLAFVTDAGSPGPPGVGRRRVIDRAGRLGRARRPGGLDAARAASSPATMYHGGFLAVSLASAALRRRGGRRPPRSPGCSSIPVLGWIGRRSYGIYLWHWPVIMVTRPQLDVTVDGWALDAARVAITLALAAASYRFVERPIIEKGVAGWMRGLLDPEAEAHQGTGRSRRAGRGRVVRGGPGGSPDPARGPAVGGCRHHPGGGDHQHHGGASRDGTARRRRHPTGGGRRPGRAAGRRRRDRDRQCPRARHPGRRGPTESAHRRNRPRSPPSATR